MQFSNHMHLIYIEHISQHFKQTKQKDRPSSTQITETNKDKLVTFMHDSSKQYLILAPFSLSFFSERDRIEATSLNCSKERPSDKALYESTQFSEVASHCHSTEFTKVMLHE